MCRRSRPGATSLLITTAALVLLLPPEPVAARQTTEHPSAETLRARLDELRPQREQAAAAAEARRERDTALLRSAAAGIASVDTLRVGMMTIVTPVEQAETARELFSEVWEESFSHIGESRALERARFAFQWGEERVPIHIEDDARPIELNSRWIRRSNVKETIAQAIASTVNYDLAADGALVGRWVSGNPLQPPTYDRVYRMIATTQSKSTRACLDGDVGECVNGLRLTMPDWPRMRDMSDQDRLAAMTSFEEVRREHLDGWYTPAERRAMVAVTPWNQNREARAAWGGCVEDGDIEVCDRYLLQRGGDIAPMPGASRESFMAYAIQQGGSGAWERLLDDPDLTAMEALEHASGRSIDELAAGWRAEVLRHRPEIFASLFPRGGLAVLWFVFFSAFAMRSTRWRLG